MTATVAFERSHHITIDAPPQAVFDYVTNPQSWPEWIAVSHHVNSANRPLGKGETFSEKWFSREELKTAAENGSLLLPPKVSVARRMIEGWLGATSLEQSKLAGETWR